MYNDLARKYGNVTVKDFRKYEKLEYKKNKLKLDIDFNNFKILYKTVRGRKIDFLEPRLFLVSLSMNISLPKRNIIVFLYNYKETRKNTCLFK